MELLAIIFILAGGGIYVFFSTPPNSEKERNKETDTSNEVLKNKKLTKIISIDKNEKNKEVVSSTLKKHIDIICHQTLCQIDEDGSVKNSSYSHNLTVTVNEHPNGYEISFYRKLSNGDIVAITLGALFLMIALIPFAIFWNNQTQKLCRAIEDAIEEILLIQQPKEQARTKPADEIGKLFELKEKGAITSEEYDLEKKKLIS